jgi:hypothetical protein
VACYTAAGQGGYNHCSFVHGSSAAGQCDWAVVAVDDYCSSARGSLAAVQHDLPVVAGGYYSSVRDSLAVVQHGSPVVVQACYLQAVAPYPVAGPCHG